MSSSIAPVRPLEVVRLVNDDDVRDLLRQAVAQDGTQRAAGYRMRVDPAIICAVLNGKRTPSLFRCGRMARAMP